MKRIALITGLILVIALGAQAADWQWPSQMDIAGFHITNISGKTGADGSGTASGTLQIPNLGNASINLSRSSRGELTGRASISANPVSGNFDLSNRGLNGHGSINCSPRSIGNASIAISSRGQASGNGTMNFGKLNIPVEFSASGSSCSANGAVPVSAKVDTAVATYRLEGRMNLQVGNGRTSATVSGRIERNGKLSNQTTSFNVQMTSVDLSNGRCTVDVGGVSVTFALF